MTPQAAMQTISLDAQPATWSATVSHMIEAVRQAPLEIDPFPHFIAEDLFPADLYREMLCTLPAPDTYRPFSYSKHAPGGVSNRGCFGLTDESIARLAGRQQDFWLGIRDALGSRDFQRAVFRKLAVGLAYRFGVSEAEAAQLPGYALPELFRETTGYRIKPHPDTRRKLVTMQIALPPDDRQAEIGTQFYRRSVNPLAMLREPRGFEVVKRAPFLPNVGYAFVVINTLRLKSWHGRTELANTAGVRNTILNIWYAKPEDANQDIVEKYYPAA